MLLSKEIGGLGNCGKPMRVALAFGQSHLGPLIRAHRALLSEGRALFDLHDVQFHNPRYQPIYRHESGKMLYNPLVLEDIKEQIEKYKPFCLIASIQAADHYIKGIFKDPRPYDFVIPIEFEGEVEPGLEIIPYDMMLRRTRDDFSWQFAIVKCVREFCDIPMYHIEAPPPVENPDVIVRSLNPLYRSRMEEFGLPSVSFRYKVWWISCQAVKNTCLDLGVEYVAGPASARTARGFLNECYNLDGVHGTDEYGKLLIEQLTEAIRPFTHTGE